MTLHVNLKFRHFAVCWDGTGEGAVYEVEGKTRRMWTWTATGMPLLSMGAKTGGSKIQLRQMHRTYNFVTKVRKHEKIAEIGWVIVSSAFIRYGGRPGTYKLCATVF